jgi:hypothetical protein
MDVNSRIGEYDSVRIGLALIAISIVGGMAAEAGWLLTIPSLMLVFGAILSLVTGHGMHVRATTRFVQGIGILFSILMAFYLEYIYRTGELEIKEGYEPIRFLLYVAILAVALFACWLLNVLWLKPMSRQLEPISRFVASVFSARTDRRAIRVKSREAFASYSVADELKKWNDRRESGVIDDKEFVEARAKILRGETGSTDQA